MKKLFSLFLLLSISLITINSFAKNKEDAVDTIDNSLLVDRLSNDDIEIIVPALIFTFRDAEIKIKFKNPEHTKLLFYKNKINFIINGEDKDLIFVNGEASFTHKFDKKNVLSIYAEDFSFTQKVTAYPLWAILLPFLMILIWIIFKRMKK